MNGRFTRAVSAAIIITAVFATLGSSAGAQGRLTLPAGAVSFVSAVADHRVDAGFGYERSTGPLFGAQIDLEPTDRMTLTLRALGGTLEAQTPAAESRGLGEVMLSTRIDVLPWLRGTAAALTRSYDGALARQRWSELSVGGEGHLALVDGLVDGSIGFALAPLVQVSGQQGPDLSVAGSARLRHSGERLDLAIGYTLERYDFATSAGVSRVEEISMLVFRAGLRIGRRRAQ